MLIVKETENNRLLEYEKNTWINQVFRIVKVLNSPILTINLLLFRCTESFPFNLIPNYYSMSGLKFPDIIKRLQTLYASKEKVSLLMKFSYLWFCIDIYQTMLFFRSMFTVKRSWNI